MTGRACEIARLPKDPMSPRRRAPPLGKRSAVTPNIVGQKYAIPIPNTVAATKAMKGVFTKLSQYKPRAENKAEPVNIPTGENRWAKGPAKNRITNIRPLV